MSTNNLERPACPLDPLVNRTIEFAYRGVRLKFDLSHALFSSYDIDAGTRLLLREIAHEPGIVEAKRVLDAGCGTGVIGVSLAASCPGMDVVMRDRDLRAVAFASRNARRNQLDCTWYDFEGNTLEPCAKPPFGKIKVKPRTSSVLIAAPGMLGQQDPLAPYDAVISNLPAKAGPKLLADYAAHVAEELLRPQGLYAFVIVAPLADQAVGWCTSAGFSILRTIATKNHLVCIARNERTEAVQKSAQSTGGGGIESASWFSRYVRSHSHCTISGANLAWDGIQGLPEFDEPSFAIRCALEAARSAFAGLLVRRLLIFEPGAGIAALWAHKVLGPAEIVLKSHDLLSLSATSWNLKKTSASAPRCIQEPFALGRASNDGLDDASFDAVFVFPEQIPQYDIPAHYWSQVRHSLKRGGSVIFASDATTIDRILRAKPEGFSRLPVNERRKGWESIAFRRD